MQLSLGWVIVFVDDAAAAAAFYQRTFGLRHDFTSPDGRYVQLDTGGTRLAFADHSVAEENVPGGVSRAVEAQRPGNVELLLVHADVDAALEAAVAAGCTLLAAAQDKPHGQRVGFVRDPFGTLVEIGTPLP